MTLLATITGLVGMLAALNLVLTIGLVRRIREHTIHLAELTGGPTVEVALPAGAKVREFSAVATDGRRVKSSELDRVLVGVFSPHCPACKVSLPRFAEVAGQPADVPFLAVVAARGEDGLPLVAQLPASTTIVMELDEGPVQQALGVAGYPAFMLIEHGMVIASSHELGDVLDQAVPAS